MLAADPKMPQVMLRAPRNRNLHPAPGLGGLGFIDTLVSGAAGIAKAIGGDGG